VVGESATRQFFNDLTRGFPLLGVFRPIM
jgi:hypothetical protein